MFRVREMQTFRECYAFSKYIANNNNKENVGRRHYAVNNSGGKLKWQLTEFLY